MLTYVSQWDLAARGYFTGAISAQKVLTVHQRASKANICLPAFVNFWITHNICENILFLGHDDKEALQLFQQCQKSVGLNVWQLNLFTNMWVNLWRKQAKYAVWHESYTVYVTVKICYVEEKKSQSVLP